MSSSSRTAVAPLLSYYARQGLWGHLEHECAKMLQKGISDSSQLNWWRAVAQGNVLANMSHALENIVGRRRSRTLGFTAVASSATGQSRHVGEAIRELSGLRSKRDLELPSVVALLHFHKCAERLDVKEIDALEEVAKREAGRAADTALLLAAQFHWYSAIHCPEEAHDLHVERLAMARALIHRVAPPDIVVAQTGMQKQAHLLLAWVEMSLSARDRAEHEQRKAAIKYLNGDRSLSSEVGGTKTRDVDLLMARAKYYELINEHKRAMDELHQAIAVQAAFVPALLEKAKIFIMVSEWDQALEAIQRVLALNERNVEALRLQLLCDLTQRAPTEAAVLKALEALARSLDRYEPRNAPLYFGTAQTLSRLARRRPRVLDFILDQFTRKALALREDQDSTYTAEVAKQLCLRGTYAEAARHFRDAGQADESNVTALYGVIYCQLMSGDLEDAAQQLDFLSAIGDSIQEQAMLPFLKAMLAWRKDKDASAHKAHLDECERLHFRHLAEASGTTPTDAVFAHFARLDPDFLLDLAAEYLEHVDADDDILGGPASQAQQSSSSSSSADDDNNGPSSTANAAVARGVETLERLSGQVPGLVEAQLLVGEARFGLGQLAAAQRSFTAAVALDDQSAAAHLLHVRIALAQQNHRAAAAALDAAVAADFGVRSSPAYLLAAARLKVVNGDADEALADLEAAMRLPGVRDGAPPGAPGGGGVPAAQRVAVFVELAACLAKLRQFEQAATILAEAQERFKQSPDLEVRVLVAQAQLAVGRNDFEGAVRLLNSVPASSPAYVRAQVVKARFYLEIRHDKRAYTQCYRDLVGYEQTAAAYERLGAAYMHIQAPEAAIEAYEQAHHINPRDAKLAAKIGRALVSTHDYLKATDYYVTALQAHADDIDLRHDLAKLFVKLRKYEGAVQVLTYALEPAGASTELPKMVQDVRSLVLLAEVYTEAENQPPPSSEADKAAAAASSMRMPDHSVSQTLMRARELQKSVLEKCRRDMESAETVADQRRILCRICRSLARFFRGEVEEKAVRYYEEAIQADPQDKDVLLELAQLLMKKGDLDACEARCSAVDRLEPRHEGATMLLADVLFLRHDADDATEKLRDLLEANPSNYVALSKLVTLLRRAGKLDDVHHFFRLAERHDLRSLAAPGFNYCKGLHARGCNDVVAAVKCFNLARRDGKWGVPALMAMIELYLNPDNETIWDDGADTTENSEASLIAEELFRELNAFAKQPPDLDLRIKVLGAYIRLSTRTKTNVDEAMQVFIDILEHHEKDYLPALLGMATAFMLENSQTKARNALKRIAKMPYAHDLADDYERGYLLLADIYIQKAKFDLAEDLCERCLKYNLSCGRAWETMGSIREKEASYKDAADMYEKAWHLEREASAPVGFKLAFNYLKAKRFVEAIDICHKILSLYPDYPKIRKDILDKAIDALRP